MTSTRRSPFDLLSAVIGQSEDLVGRMFLPDQQFVVFRNGGPLFGSAFVADGGVDQDRFSRSVDRRAAAEAVVFALGF